VSKDDNGTVVQSPVDSLTQVVKDNKIGVGGSGSSSSIVVVVGGGEGGVVGML